MVDVVVMAATGVMAEMEAMGGMVAMEVMGVK
jgi:hypothetical protein